MRNRQSPELKTDYELLFHFLHLSLWGTKFDFSHKILESNEYENLMKIAKQQAISGLIGNGLIKSRCKLSKYDAIDLYSNIGVLKEKNKEMNTAIIKFYKMMADYNIRLLFIKGQTLAVLYPDCYLRSPGDIDFYCHHEDIKKAKEYLKLKHIDIENLNDEKHIEFRINDIQYEMHNMLTTFAYPKHHKYWEHVVMNEILEYPFSIEINDKKIPTLAPTYNALYIFIHIFYHFIIEGIGLRQFCDWAIFLSKYSEEIDAERLEQHLNGIGLKKAYTGLGTILTEYIGMPEKYFPLRITDSDRRNAPILMRNIIKKGNFGHNVQYYKDHGSLHAIQYLYNIGKQTYQFYHYAPAEALWRIPNMFKWYTIKIKRILSK